MKNKVFLTLDSLRWDVFDAANTPFLSSLGTWKKAQTQATYTFPAHMSFFVGKLPQTTDKTDYYDTSAIRFQRFTGRAIRRKQLWRLGNPEAPRPAAATVEGENIIVGFRSQGYRTIGTGAMNWFNPNLPAGRYLSEPFDKFIFFEGPGSSSHRSARRQVDWALERTSESETPFFLFINFGETHHPFSFEGSGWEEEKKNPYGDAGKCWDRQKACLEYLDGEIERLLSGLREFDLVICGDHGEAMGEDGLWGHGFAHETVLDVPLLINVCS